MNNLKGWGSKDRIAYNDDGKTLDEAVMIGANVHLEQMDENNFTLIVENKKHRWYISIGSRSKRANVDAILYDSESKKP